MTEQHAPDEAPETCELMIGGLGVSGDGVGRLPDGRVVFVAGALPGDRVRVRLERVHKKVQYAEVEEILQASPHREPAACRIERCGGCPLRGLSGAAQADQKRTRVIETLRRIGGFTDVANLLGPVVQVGNGWTYRHRVRLHATWQDERWLLGYHERRSQCLVPIRHCPVLWAELEAAARRLSEAIASVPREARIEDVEVAYSRRDGRAAARFRIRGPLASMRSDKKWLEASGLSGVEVHASDGRWRFGNLGLRYDHAGAEHYDLHYEPGLFTQAFPEANDRLTEAVMHALRVRGGTRILELHAGIGNFSVPVARAGGRVHAVERDRRAAVLCGRNAASPGLDLTVSAATDEASVATADQYDAILLDPPRTGAREVAEHLRASGPPVVVYVSCDPATFARDAGYLRDGGYRMTSIQAFDFFPQTPHVEILSVFERP